MTWSKLGSRQSACRSILYWISAIRQHVVQHIANSIKFIEWCARQRPMQKHQARVSLFTSLFNIIHPCGKQIKAQIACFNQWTAPLEEHFFRRSRQAMNDIHLAATSQPVMMAGKVTQAISAQKMFFFIIWPSNYNISDIYWFYCNCQIFSPSQPISSKYLTTTIMTICLYIYICARN